METMSQATPSVDRSAERESNLIRDHAWDWSVPLGVPIADAKEAGADIEDRLRRQAGDYWDCCANCDDNDRGVLGVTKQVVVLRVRAEDWTYELANIDCSDEVAEAVREAHRVEAQRWHQLPVDDDEIMIVPRRDIPDRYDVSRYE